MEIAAKACTKCHLELPASSFYSDKLALDGLRSACKVCFKATCAARKARDPEHVRAIGRASSAKNRRLAPDKANAWNKANREKVRKMQREWAARNPEKMQAKYRRRYQQQDPDQRREAARNRYWEVLKHKPDWRIKTTIASRMNRAIRSGKSGRSLEALLGYTIAELMTHLERQFAPGMTWGNHGKWHIDHIVPLVAFQIDSYESPDFARAWALSNLRPLWGAENVRKSGKVLHLC